MQNLAFKRFKIRWFILLFIVMSIVSGAFLAFSENGQYATDISNIILAGSLTLYLIYKWKSHHLSFSESTLAESMTKKRWAKYISFTFLVKITGLFAMLLASAIILYLFEDLLGWIIDLMNSVQYGNMTPLNYVFLFISICILAPLWEELFFRGILLRRFAMKWKASTSIIVSSLIFGLMHFGGNSMIHATLFGCLMGFVYLKTQNIWVPIALHSISNFMSFITVLLPSSDEITIAVPSKEELQQTVWVSAVLFVVCTAIFVYFIIKNWHKVRAIPKIQEPVIETVDIFNQVEDQIMEVADQTIKSDKQTMEAEEQVIESAEQIIKAEISSSELDETTPLTTDSSKEQK